MKRLVSAAMSAAFAASMIAVTAEAAPASKMQLKMTEFFVKEVERGAGRVSEARQRVDSLKKTSGDDPAVIALDERLRAVEAKKDAARAAKEAAGRAEREKREAEAKALVEAEKKAEQKRRQDAEQKAKENASAAPAAAAHAAPLPWVMAKDDKGMPNEPVAKYIDALGRLSNSKEAGDLKKALEARAEEDRRIVAAGGEGVWEAQQELKRYDSFLSELGQMTLVGFFEGTVDLEKNSVDFSSLRVRTPNSSVYVKCSAQDKKLYFYESNGARCFVEGDDLAMVVEAQRRYFYVSYFLEGQKDVTYRKNAAAAMTMFNYIRTAIENNSPDNIDFSPMPKKGALHAEHAAAALECAKKSQSYSDAVEVIIDADEWTIERNALGAIVRRKFGAWAIKQLPRGKRAYRAQWCQDHQGGGQYGKLRLFGVGGGQMYVK